MDPLYELAGALLARLDHQWSPSSARTSREGWVTESGPIVRPLPRDWPRPTIPSSEQVDELEEYARKRIELIKQRELDVNALRVAEFARSRTPRQRADGHEASASERIVSTSEASYDSLRVRRDLLTIELYQDPDFALTATRVVGAYPRFLAELARTATTQATEDQLRAVKRAAAVEGVNLGPVAARFHREGPEAIADRLVTDPAFADAVIDELETPRPFTYVLRRELSEIHVSRQARATQSGDDEKAPARGAAAKASEAAVDETGAPSNARIYPLNAAHQKKLLGLSLSGGGIRSATFGLGVLQGLAELGLLRRVDYLSTVSGGGYIGSWLVAWIKRLQGGVREAQQRLCPWRAAAPNTIEARPIRMLREYSNYLTPKASLLSADAWTLVAVWTRNSLLNQAVIVLFLSSVLLLPRVLAPAISAVPYAFGVWLFVMLMVISSSLIGWNLRLFDDVGHPAPASSSKELGQDDRWILAAIIFPLMGASLIASVWMWGVARGHYIPAPWLGSLREWLSAHASFLSSAEWQIALIAAIVLFAGLFSAQIVGRYGACILTARGRALHRIALLRAHVGLALCALVAAAVGGVLCALVARFVASLPADEGFWYAITLTPPIALEAIALAIVLHIGLIGRSFPDARREWWSRLGAQQLRISVVWFAAFGVSIFAPAIARLTVTRLIPLVIAWAGTTWAGVIAGKAAKTGGGGTNTEPKGGWLHLVAVVAPYVFIAGLLIAVSVLIHYILVQTICPNDTCLPSVYYTRWLEWESMDTHEWFIPLIVMVLALLASLILSNRADVNEFSMHHFYKNRLVRCFLGASRDIASRRPNLFTGFDPRDDEPLKNMRRLGKVGGPPYQGPYLIVNTALNLTKGRELSWQERKAEPFVFTPHFTGYELDEHRDTGGRNLRRAGYRPTEQFGYPGGPHIGTVAAISGAAANPNMGYHSSPATAFLLTLFNARLGWWVGNPRRKDMWRKSSPLFGLIYLLRELIGSADNTTRYINLSDGGHFENLGIYELVRRRCRFIIAVDAEQDASMTFNGLANAIRKCRTDFGVYISIDLSNIRKQANGRSAAHCVMGRVYYPEPSTESGWLFYIKSSITGNETADVLEYVAREPDFPHESTNDQWFDESQFESYRVLGYHASIEALRVAASNNRTPQGLDLDKLFESLQGLWTPAPGPDER